MIGILGPTGQIGTALMPAVARTGAPVRALAHSHESAIRMAHEAVDVFTGDMRDPAVLARFLGGVSTLFLLTPATPDQTEVQNRIVDAAVAAEVDAIVKFSVYTAADDALCSFSRWHAANDRYLAESGPAYTILHPHTFMQSIALQFAAGIRAGGMISAAVRPDATISMVDARDVAEVCAAVLVNGDHRGETILITGPEALSYPDCAERIGAALGREVGYEEVAPEQAYKQFVAAGLPDWIADGLVALHRMYDTGELNPVTDVVPRLTGKPARTLADFVDDNVGLFR